MLLRRYPLNALETLLAVVGAAAVAVVGVALGLALAHVQRDTETPRPRPLQLVHSPDVPTLNRDRERFATR